VTSTETTPVENIGIIDSFRLPQGWTEALRAEPMAGRTLRLFHPLEQPRVRFCTYERTVTLSRPTAEVFKQVLYSEFHDLAQAEIDQLQPIFEGMSNSGAFQIREATTGYLNSRRTLRIRGRWLRPQEDTLSLFFDVRGDGELVQQIYFTAPVVEFEDYREDADSIFTSIKWKP
jgi:hypothetical protein